MYTYGRDAGAPLAHGKKNMPRGGSWLYLNTRDIARVSLTKCERTSCGGHVTRARSAGPAYVTDPLPFLLMVPSFFLTVNRFLRLVSHSIYLSPSKQLGDDRYRSRRVSRTTKVALKFTPPRTRVVPVLPFPRCVLLVSSQPFRRHYACYITRCS